MMLMSVSVSPLFLNQSASKRKSGASPVSAFSTYSLKLSAASSMNYSLKLSAASSMCPCNHRQQPWLW